MINPAELKEELTARQCLYLNTKTQFIGTGGKHLAGYCNLDPLLIDVNRTAELTEEMLKPFEKKGIETVLAPAVGEIVISTLGAYLLSKATGRNVLGVFADKKRAGKGLELKRAGAIEAVAGRRVLIVNDVVNQGWTVSELLRITDELDAETVGVATIVANEGAAERVRAPLHTLCEIQYGVWTPEECRLSGPCAEQQPIVIDGCLGHGAEYQLEHPDYQGGYIILRPDYTTK